MVGRAATNENDGALILTNGLPGTRFRLTRHGVAQALNLMCTLRNRKGLVAGMNLQLFFLAIFCGDSGNAVLLTSCGTPTVSMLTLQDWWSSVFEFTKQWT